MHRENNITVTSQKTAQSDNKYSSAFFRLQGQFRHQFRGEPSRRRESKRRNTGLKMNICICVVYLRCTAEYYGVYELSVV